jgi:nitrogen regulatory protein P-II 1
VKKIQAVVGASTLDDVKEALMAAGVQEVVVETVKDFSHGKGDRRYRGVEYRIDYRPRIRIDIVVEDHACEPAITALCAALRRSDPSDGAVTVVSCDGAVPIDPWETLLAARAHDVTR